MFARNARTSRQGCMVLSNYWEVQEPQVPAGVLGAEPLT